MYIYVLYVFSMQDTYHTIYTYVCENNICTYILASYSLLDREGDAVEFILYVNVYLFGLCKNLSSQEIR